MFIKVYYPDVVLNIRDVKAAIDAGDAAGDALEDALQELDDNTGIKTSRESGISRREKILGIQPIDTALLEDRRTEVLLRWYSTPIYTERTLKRVLDTSIGKELYRLLIDLDKKMVLCELEKTSLNIVNAVENLLEEMVPLDYGIGVVQYLENTFYTTGIYIIHSHMVNVMEEINCITIRKNMAVGHVMLPHISLI